MTVENSTPTKTDTVQRHSEIQSKILEQLTASKVRGFAFFAYTGIKKFVVVGEDEIRFECPKNPGKIKVLAVKYIGGSDMYTVLSLKNKNGIAHVSKTQEDVYCDGLAEIMVSEMKVD